MRARWILAVLGAGVTACSRAAGPSVNPQSGPYDLLIANGTIVDGTGSARYRGDVAIMGDRIVRVERGAIRGSGKRTIDASGLIVAPGFIDLHAHLDPVMQMPDAQSAAMQGVTLALGGPDGGGPWPFGPYLDSLDKKPLGINVAFLAGHNSIRRSVMGTANRAPTSAELSRMESMVAQSMNEGAFGMSTGLRYIPGFYSNTDEVIALSKVAADAGASTPLISAKKASVSSRASAKRSRSGDVPGFRSSSRTTKRSAG